MRKLLSICVALATISAISVTAQDIDPSMKLIDWKTNTVQQVGDKKFTFVSSTLPTNSTVTFSLSSQLALLSVAYDGGNMQANGQTLNFTIAIDQTLSPSDYFYTVSMDTSMIVGPTTEATKLVEPNVTLTSVNGNPSAVWTNTNTGLKFITVNNTYTGGGYLVNETIAFQEVPEPTTIGLAAIGLLGALTIRCRKI